MKKELILTALIASLFTGCARYEATALASIPPEYIYRAPVQNGVVAAAKPLDQNDCKRYLDRDVLSKGYQPIQLYIENKSDQAYYFSTDRVSLPLASPEEVAEKVHTSTLGRIAGYGAMAVIATPLFLIPAVVDGYKSSEANDSLDSDFVDKGAKNIVIGPHSHVNMLLFVPQEGYRDSFQVTLLDEGSHNANRINVFCGSAS